MLKDKRKENVARIGNQIRLATRKYIQRWVNIIFTRVFSRYYDQSFSCTDSMCRFKVIFWPGVDPPDERAHRQSIYH